MTARTCWRENEDYIATVIAEYPADFADLVSPYVVDAISSSTSHLAGEAAAELPRNLPVERKTAVRPFNYVASDRPTHFAHTKCVFGDELGFCRLETLARALNIHPWTFKPSACWLVPLRIVEGEPAAPPSILAADPDRLGVHYPGYASFAQCGRNTPYGAPWHDVLAGEISYFDAVASVPVWALSGKTVAEIVAEQLHDADSNSPGPTLASAYIRYVNTCRIYAGAQS